MSFDARQSTISKLLSDAIYRIPRNQRRYVWNDQNWGDLYNDILLVADGTAVSSHFLGSIVLKEEDSESGIDVYTVIDGQQRIITLTILIAAVIFQFKKRGMEEDAKGTVKYVVAIDNKGNDREIVDPEHHRSLPKIAMGVAQIDVSSIKKKTASGFAKERRISNDDDLIVKGFVYFDGELSRLDNDKLITFRDALVGTQYVRISSSSDEDLYTIFEILNARGLPLDDSDLLKNFVMRYIQPESKRDDAKAEWLEIERNVGNSLNTFLRHYAIHCCRFTSSDRDVYKKIRDTTDPHEAQSLLDDLILKSGYYKRFLQPDNASPEGLILSYFKQHRVQVFRPLILSLMHKYGIEEISEELYLDSLKFIYRFHVCDKVIGGFDSNHLTDSIAKYSYAIEKQFTGEETLIAWRTSFQEKLPSRESFLKSFSAIGWSHHYAPFDGQKNKERCRVVLEMLEESTSGENLSGEYTIEHILPDASIDAHSSIGNLLLLEEKLNQKCKDFPLKDKLSLYSQSRFATTRGFAKRYSDKEFDIEQRTYYMCKAIYNLIRQP